MHYKTTCILLLAVCVTGCFIWIVEWKTGSQDRPRMREQRLMNIEPEKMSYVSFYRGGTFIECVNEHGQWFINRPIRARADNSEIHHLLAIMEMLPKGEAITLSERQARELTLDDYGLADPRARVVLGEKEHRRKLTIGGDSPLKDAVYVRLNNEEEVIATSTNVLNIIPFRVDDIRDRRLLRGSPSYVTRLEIKRHDRPMLQLVKEGAQWILYKPVIARADWVKISSLLDHLFSIRVQEFVSETMADPEAYGLSDDEAILRINLWQRQEQDGEKVFFGKDADGEGGMVYANRMGSSSICAVRKSMVESVRVNASDLRDSRIYFMATDSIKFIRVEAGDSILQLHKLDGSGWQIVKPNQWPAHARAVTDLLNRLNALRIAAFVDGTVTNLQVLGLDKPARVIRLADSLSPSGTATQGVEQITVPPVRSERSLRLSNVRPGQEYVHAQFEDEPQVYQISAAAASTFSIDSLAYRDPMVLVLDPLAVRTITLRKDGAEQCVKRDASGSWKPVLPASGEVDRTVIRDILAQVTGLGVSRFECSGIKNLSVYGLQNAPVSLTFGLTGEEGLQKSVVIGERSEDLGVYAMLQGQDVVFVLEKEIVDLLTRDLIR
ncbi:DUF4340 domain-containing protein [Verrucomicrobiota bacterium]